MVRSLRQLSVVVSTLCVALASSSLALAGSEQCARHLDAHDPVQSSESIVSLKHEPATSRFLTLIDQYIKLREYAPLNTTELAHEIANLMSAWKDVIYSDEPLEQISWIQDHFNDIFVDYFAQLLESRSIRYEVDQVEGDIKVLKILPDAHGSIENKIAERIKKTSDVDIVLNPVHQLESFNGAYRASENTISLSPWTLASPLQTINTLIHEVMHAYYTRWLKEGKNSLVMGYFSSTDRAAMQGFSGEYSTYLSIEELATHSYNVSLSVRQLKAAYRKQIHRVELINRLQRLLAYADRGLYLSKRVKKLAALTKSRLDADQLVPVTFAPVENELRETKAVSVVTQFKNIKSVSFLFDTDDIRNLKVLTESQQKLSETLSAKKPSPPGLIETIKSAQEALYRSYNLRLTEQFRFAHALTKDYIELDTAIRKFHRALSSTSVHSPDRKTTLDRMLSQSSIPWKTVRRYQQALKKPLNNSTQPLAFLEAAE